MRPWRPLWLYAALAASLADAGPLAVVQSLGGTVRAAHDRTAERDVEAFDLLRTGVRLETGATGNCVLRMLLDKSTVELFPRSILVLEEDAAKGVMVRRLVLAEGRLTASVRDSNLVLRLQGPNTLLRRGRGSWSFAAEGERTVLIVRSGWAELHNRPKDAQGRVRAGQKADSDLDGLRITDATEEELAGAGFRRQRLEVDFQNPQSEEFGTLEVEYETDF